LGERLSDSVLDSVRDEQSSVQVREGAPSMLPPKPANTVFGIRVDGKTRSIGLRSLAEAEAAAGGLVSQGRRVEIFDKVTGRVIKRL
jgi:hypothetical protein